MKIRVHGTIILHAVKSGHSHFGLRLFANMPKVAVTDDHEVTDTSKQMQRNCGVY